MAYLVCLGSVCIFWAWVGLVSGLGIGVFDTCFYV